MAAPVGFTTGVSPVHLSCPYLPDDPSLPMPLVIAAWGMGLDSTAMIIEWVARGWPLHLVLTADTGSERPETYDYLPIFQRWMDAHGIEHQVVSYAPKRFKHWPPYFTLLENCLTNATLPSISFGRHSCSLGPGETNVLLACREESTGRATR